MIRTQTGGRRMPHALEAPGDAALAAVMRKSPLLGFDFDGTLAPIVPQPDQVRISQSVSRKLRRLAQRLPVAIVSGRTADDVRRFLDFEPYCIVGNHGADLAGAADAELEQSLAGIRALLAAHAADLARMGVTVEDKGLSIALHYRLSRRPGEAVALIREVLHASATGCRVFGGKMVENVLPLGVPDKGEAMQRIVRQCGAPCALFVGDDVNDEPVFAAAPENWLGIRIGRQDPHSLADYFLDSTAEVGMLLDRLIAHMEA
jgi:trehalose 6-phosphate phosphatase